MYLVDIVSVQPARVEEYLDVLRAQMVPLYQAAGATFEHCRTTAANLGETVEVELVWSFADNAAWNGIRRNLVLDGRYYQGALALAELRLRGTRRFKHDAPSIGTGRP